MVIARDVFRFRLLITNNIFIIIVQYLTRYNNVGFRCFDGALFAISRGTPGGEGAWHKVWIGTSSWLLQITKNRVENQIYLFIVRRRVRDLIKTSWWGRYSRFVILKLIHTKCSMPINANDKHIFPPPIVHHHISYYMLCL